MTNSNVKELDKNEMIAITGGSKWLKLVFEYLGRAYGEMNALQQKYNDDGMWMH